MLSGAAIAPAGAEGTAPVLPAYHGPAVACAPPCGPCGCPVTVEASWLTWGDGVVFKLARVIYDERRFGDLPVLADALEGRRTF